MALGTYSMTSPVTKPVPLCGFRNHHHQQNQNGGYKLRKSSTGGPTESTGSRRFFPVKTRVNGQLAWSAEVAKSTPPAAPAEYPWFLSVASDRASLLAHGEWFHLDSIWQATSLLMKKTHKIWNKIMRNKILQSVECGRIMKDSLQKYSVFVDL